MRFSSWKKNMSKLQAESSENKIGPTKLVNKNFFSEESTLPIVYKPMSPSVDLATWWTVNKPVIDRDLHKYGGILFRGFNITSQKKFKKIVDATLQNKAAYIEGATPRTELEDGIYTSTEFPVDQEIALHNELSYVINPPTFVMFCCIIAAESGGQTQIADVTKVRQRIDKKIIDEFERRGGWLLKRNYGNGFGPSVQKAFGLKNIDAIKQYCESADVEIEVLSDSRVSTKQRRAVVHTHPYTDENAWFNHVSFWHPSTLCPKVKAQLDKVLSLKEFPYCTYFADGEEIPESTIDKIRKAYLEEEVVFDWAAGDVLLLDNRKVAHGRKPFSGDRKILVAMG